jgi:uncharacterized protein YehS (DUF1456 family)
VLRRLRYALDLDDARARHLFALGGRPVEPAALQGFLARDDAPGFVACPDADLAAFLDGLVTDRRGPRDPAAPPRPKDDRLDNNVILKKLRVALELQEQDLLELMRLEDRRLSPSELSAFFRKPDHKHYRRIGDQLLRAFLQNLATKLRG